jgi:hypothetical protein
MLSSTFCDEMGYLPLDELGATDFLPTGQRPL